MPNTHTSTSDGFSDALKLMASIFGEALGEIALKDAAKENATRMNITADNPDVVNISTTRQKYTESMDKLAKADRLQDTINKMHKDLTAERNRSASHASTIAANEKTIKKLQEEIDKLKMAEPRSVDVIIIDSVAYDEGQIRELLSKTKVRSMLVDGQLYTGERIRQMVAAQASAKDYRQMVVDTEARWRAHTDRLETTKRALDSRIIALESEVKHERNLRQHYQADTARLGRELAIFKHNAASRGECDINKLRKNLTAEQNRVRSHETTIGELRFKVQDLEAKLAAVAPDAASADHYTLILHGKPYTRAELEALVKTPTNVITVNGVHYSADDIQQIVNTSCERADTIAELVKQRDDAVNKAMKYAEQVHTYSYQGRELTPEEIGRYLDLGIAAENAHLTVGYMNALNTVPAKPTQTTRFIEVEHPDRDFVRLKFPGRTIDIAASLIPEMADEANQLRVRVRNYEEREKSITRRNKEQANSLKAAEAEIEKLREQIDNLSKVRAENSKTIQQLTTERNLLRGRLNERSHSAVINGQTLQAGEAYMTTALGLLPINSTGMRQLSDALDSYRARVQKLTNGLREWIKE